MPEFLVETYLSRYSAGPLGPDLVDVLAASEDLSSEGRPVRLVRSLYLPAEETCLYIFEAQTSDLVVELAKRCDLRFERLVGAVSNGAVLTAEQGMER